MSRQSRHFSDQVFIGNSRDQILRDLQNASEPDLSESRYQLLPWVYPKLIESNRRFIPRRSLLHILDKQTVAEHLSILLHDSQPLDQIVDYISPGQEEACHCEDSLCPGSRILFASLMRIGRELLMVDLYNQKSPRLCDSSLPFLDQSQLPKALNDLTEKEKQLFRHAQWQLRCHYLKRLGPEDHEPRKLDNEAALPFLPIDDEEKIINGELSIVRYIRIDHEHHNLDENENHFALKTFGKNSRVLSEEHFQDEFKANQQAPRHNRIVTVLAAFKHRERFHLIFPLATGGNLEELWKAFSASNTSWYSTRWLLSECLGIAEGLVAIHQPTITTGLGTQHHPVPQLHGDIKPRNILCFETAEGGTKSYNLKISDFGVAHKVYEGSSLEISRVAHTKTYRPPEYDTEDFVDLNYDIWCLGCVYLEFITWAILGWSEVEDFARYRIYERDDPYTSITKGGDYEDTFFKKEAQTPRWYDLSGLKFKIESNIKRTSKKTTTREQSIRINRGNIRIFCKVKESVARHIDKVISHEMCAPEIQGFLDFIKTRMLVIDPGTRANSSDVETFLRNMTNRWYNQN
ncbi:kinase-like protein [Xylaria digitata]|nr:kinase-like protein [Xylaria digitata]